MQGGPPCKDPIAQFCNAAVTVAPKRAPRAVTGGQALDFGLLLPASSLERTALHDPACRRESYV